jgi:hypothetical protein
MDPRERLMRDSAEAMRRDAPRRPITPEDVTARWRTPTGFRAAVGGTDRPAVWSTQGQTYWGASAGPAPAPTPRGRAPDAPTTPDGGGGPDHWRPGPGRPWRSCNQGPTVAELQTAYNNCVATTEEGCSVDGLVVSRMEIPNSGGMCVWGVECAVTCTPEVEPPTTDTPDPGTGPTDPREPGV